MAKTVEEKLTPIYNASSEDVEVLYAIKDGKRAVTPVILCDIDGNPITPSGGGGTELDPIWVADKPNYYTKSETNAQLDTKQNTLVAGANITIDPTTNTISSTGGGTSGTDTKLSIDPLKTKWDGTNKNLVLSNTDDTNITVPMDTLIDYVEYSNNNNTLNDAIALKSDLTYVDTEFTNLENALTNKADKVNVYTKTEIDASRQGSYSRRVTVGNYAINDNTTNFNLFNDTIDFTEISNLLVTTFDGTTNKRLKFAPNTKTGNKDTYSIELRIFSTTPPSEGSGTTRQDIRFDLVSGTNDNLITREIVTRNEFSNGAAKVNFDTFTSGASDPMVATGFKILISNTTGVNLTDLGATLLITRTN